MEERSYELVKFINNEFILDVKISPLENTIWMSLDDIAVLYLRDKSVISRHIRNIYSNNELEYNSTVSKNAIVQLEGKRKVSREIIYYNLNVIIGVSYRVNSKMGTVFRIWANEVLKEYLLKGYVINENRVVVSNENYIELKNQITNINNRLITLEDKVLEKVYKIDKIFYNKEFYDSYTLIQSIFESSNNR